MELDFIGLKTCFITLLVPGLVFELFDVETRFYGTMALIISSIGGAVLAIKHSYDGELEKIQL